MPFNDLSFGQSHKIEKSKITVKKGSSKLSVYACQEVSQKSHLICSLFHFSQKLKAIASSASNTWGLFLLVILLGYALVEIPRNLWLFGQRGYALHHAYFRAAKLNFDKSEAEETLDDVLEVIIFLHIFNLSVV